MDKEFKEEINLTEAAEAGDKKHKKHIVWDNQKIAEQELEKKLHPKMKITEPKTPYAGNAINSDDDDYMEDLLHEVTRELEKHRDQMTVNFSDIPETKKDEEKKKEFMQKRKLAYKNEFSMAKTKMNDEDEEDADECQKRLEETMKNTLFNKFVGKIAHDTHKNEAHNDEVYNN